MQCAAHPEVETNLSCGKCGKPICPRCMVQTAVGARCPECARLYKLPTYRVSRQYYLRAAGTALGMAVVTGVFWGVLRGFIPFLIISLLLGPGVGYVIGEVVGRAVNRKRGRGLATVASLGVVLSYLVSIFLLSVVMPWGFHLGGFGILLDLVAVGLGIFVAVTRLR